MFVFPSVYLLHFFICLHFETRSTSCPEHYKGCQQFLSHTLQRFKTTNHSVHITERDTVDHIALFALLLNYYPVFLSSLSLPRTPFWRCCFSDVSRKICQIFTSCISICPIPHPSFFLHPLCLERNCVLSHVGEEEKRLLKSLMSLKKKKKGCYLIKEAAINLSPSSAALLHIWPFSPATHCCSFSLRPAWDLWFALLVSHVV